MASPSETARAAILGVPFDPNKKPDRLMTVKAFEQMDAKVIGVTAGAIIRDSKANLDAVTTPPANQMAWVMGDSVPGNNGVYQNTGTSGSPVWTRRGDLPYSLISLINVGAGTPDAILAASSLPVPAAIGAALFTVNILAANTGNVTINGKPLRTNSGNEIAPDGLTAGSMPVFVDLGDHFRLMSDQASAAVLAAAEAARDVTLSAVPNIFPVDLAALKAIETGTHVAADVRPLGQYFWQTGDFSDDEDGYSVVKADDTAITAGAWVRRFDRAPRPQDFGGTDTAAIDRVMNYAARETGEVQFAGVYERTVSQLDLLPGLDYVGVGSRGAIFDGSGLPKTDTGLVSDFTRGLLKISSGSRGSPVLLDADVVSNKNFRVSSLSKSGTTATVVTGSPHGLATGDLVWMIWPGGWPSLPANGLYFLSQAQSTEQMPLTQPFSVVVVNDTTFSYTVDAGAPEGVFSGASAFLGWKNDRQIVTSTAHGLNVGDWVEVSSDKTVPAVPGYQVVQYGEIAQVVRCPDQYRAVLDRPIKYEYLVADNACFRALDLPDAKIRNITIIGRGSTETTTNYDGDSGLSVDLMGDVLIEDVRIRDCAYLSMTVRRARSIVINRPVIEAVFADDAGRATGVTKECYGIAYGNWYDKLSINDAYVHGNFRHGICETTSGGSNYPGIGGRVEINNPTVIGSTSNCMATHFPNDGLRVFGGFVSGNEFGLDARGGHVLVDGLRGEGGWGLINIYGFCHDVQVKNVTGRNFLRMGMQVAPSAGSAYTQPVVTVENCNFINTGLYGVYIYSYNVDYSMITRVRDCHIVGALYEGVHVESQGDKPGQTSIVGISGADLNRSSAVTTYAANMINQDRVFVDDIRVVPTGGQANYGVSFASCTNIVLGDRIDRATTPLVTLTIDEDGAIDVSTRADDFVAVIKGAGGVADNLDYIKGLRAGQRVTLFRFSETITIRDNRGSPPSGAVAIQTPGSTNITISSAYNAITIIGVNNSGANIYPVVEIVRTDA